MSSQKIFNKYSQYGRSNRTRGWTLIDLVVCLALISLFVVASVPARGEIEATARLASASRRMERVIIEASHNAQRWERDLILIVLPKSYRVVTADSKVPVGSVAHLTGSLEALVPALGRQVRFTAGGVATPASFRLRSGNRHCTIVLALRGRVRRECI